MATKTIELGEYDGAIIFRANSMKEEVYINDMAENPESEWTRYMVCYLAYAIGKVEWLKKFEEIIRVWEKEEEKIQSNQEKDKLKASLKIVEGGDKEDKEDDS